MTTAVTLSRQQQRRDTALTWAAANPVLAVGEIGFETDTGRFKFGDGSTPWSTLPYTAAPAPGEAPIPTGSALLDTPQLQAHINSALAAGYREVVLQEGRYALQPATTIGPFANACVTASAGIVIRGKGPGTVIDMSQNAGACTAFMVAGTGQGTVGQPTVALTADAPQGSVTIAVSASDPNVGTLAAGGWVNIGVPGFAPNQRSNPHGEQTQIKSVSGGTITLADPLDDDYLVAYGARLMPLAPVDSVGLHDLEILGPPAPGPEATATATTLGLRVDTARNVDITGVTFTDCHYAGIGLYDVWDWRVSDCHFRYAQSAGLAYGLMALYGTQDGSMTGCTGLRMRHMFTAGGGTGRCGIPRRINVEGNEASQIIEAAFDCHPQGKDINFIGNTVAGSENAGIEHYGRSGVITGNIIKNTAGNGVLVVPGSGMRHHFIVGENIIGGVAANPVSGRSNYGVLVQSYALTATSPIDVSMVGLTAATTTALLVGTLPAQTPVSGQINIPTSNGGATLAYASITGGNTFAGLTFVSGDNTGTITAGSATFYRVYTADGTVKVDDNDIDGCSYGLRFLRGTGDFVTSWYGSASDNTVTGCSTNAAPIILQYFKGGVATGNEFDVSSDSRNGVQLNSCQNMTVSAYGTATPGKSTTGIYLDGYCSGNLIIAYRLDAFLTGIQAAASSSGNTLAAGLVTNTATRAAGFGVNGNLDITAALTPYVSQQPGDYLTPQAQAPNSVSTIATNNKIVLTRFVPQVTRLYPHLTFAVSTAATNNESYDVGIYDSSGHLLGHSGATAGQLQAAGVVTAPMIAPITLQALTAYYAALLSTYAGGTGPSFTAYSFGTLYGAEMFGATIPNVELAYTTASSGSLPATLPALTGAISSAPVIAGLTT